jgi:hypothetical protein
MSKQPRSFWAMPSILIPGWKYNGARGLLIGLFENKLFISGKKHEIHV